MFHLCFDRERRENFAGRLRILKGHRGSAIVRHNLCQRLQLALKSMPEVPQLEKIQPAGHREQSDHAGSAGHKHHLAANRQVTKAGASREHKPISC